MFLRSRKCCSTGNWCIFQRRNPRRSRPRWQGPGHVVQVVAPHTPRSGLSASPPEDDKALFLAMCWAGHLQWDEPPFYTVVLSSTLSGSLSLSVLPLAISHHIQGDPGRTVMVNPEGSGARRHEHKLIPVTPAILRLCGTRWPVWHSVVLQPAVQPAVLRASRSRRHTARAPVSRRQPSCSRLADQALAHSGGPNAKCHPAKANSSNCLLRK